MKQTKLLDHVEYMDIDSQNLAEIRTENFESLVSLENELLMKQNQYLLEKVNQLEIRMEEQLFLKLDLILAQEEFVMNLDDYAFVNEAKGSIDSYEYEKLHEEYRQLQQNFEVMRNSKVGKIARKYWKLMRYLRRR